MQHTLQSQPSRQALVAMAAADTCCRHRSRTMTAAHLLMAGIHRLPCFLNLLFEGHNGLLVLLAELEGCLHLCGIAHNLRVELSALLDQPLLIVCKSVCTQEAGLDWQQQVPCQRNLLLLRCCVGSAACPARMAAPWACHVPPPTV